MRLQAKHSLWYAAKNGFSEVISMHITESTDFCAQNSRGMTALLLAAKAGQASTVHKLLELGAKPELTYWVRVTEGGCLKCFVAMVLCVYR